MAPPMRLPHFHVVPNNVIFRRPFNHRQARELQLINGSSRWLAMIMSCTDHSAIGFNSPTYARMAPGAVLEVEIACEPFEEQGNVERYCYMTITITEIKDSSRTVKENLKRAEHFYKELVTITLDINPTNANTEKQKQNEQVKDNTEHSAKTNEIKGIQEERKTTKKKSDQRNQTHPDDHETHHETDKDLSTISPFAADKLNTSRFERTTDMNTMVSMTELLASYGVEEERRDKAKTMRNNSDPRTMSFLDGLEDHEFSRMVRVHGSEDSCNEYTAVTYKSAGEDGYTLAHELEEWAKNGNERQPEGVDCSDNTTKMNTAEESSLKTASKENEFSTAKTFSARSSLNTTESVIVETNTEVIGVDRKEKGNKCQD